MSESSNSCILLLSNVMVSIIFKTKKRQFVILQTSHRTKDHHYYCHLHSGTYIFFLIFSEISPVYVLESTMRK